MKHQSAHRDTGISGIVNSALQRLERWADSCLRVEEDSPTDESRKTFQALLGNLRRWQQSDLKQAGAIHELVSHLAESEIRLIELKIEIERTQARIQCFQNLSDYLKLQKFFHETRLSPDKSIPIRPQSEEESLDIIGHLIEFVPNLKRRAVEGDSIELTTENYRAALSNSPDAILDSLLQPT